MSTISPYVVSCDSSPFWKKKKKGHILAYFHSNISVVGILDFEYMCMRTHAISTHSRSLMNLKHPVLTPLNTKLQHCLRLTSGPCT